VKLGFFSWFGYDLPFQDRLSLIAQAGFRDISVWLGSEEQLYSQGRSREMRAIAAHEGLDIQCAHAACRDCNLLWDGTNEDKRQLRKQIIYDLDLCKELHAPTMVMHACAGATPPSPNQEGLDLIRDVANHAEAANVVVALENTRKPEVIDYVLSRVDSPYIGFCYDSCHDFLYSCNPGELLRSWGHRLVYTHFNDTDGKLTRHWIPGKGIVDWQLIADVFPEQFTGNLSLEVEPMDPRFEPVEMFLRESLHAAQWLEASLRK
jgi:sugar phosphate isomerase/epimerase